MDEGLREEEERRSAGELEETRGKRVTHLKLRRALLDAVADLVYPSHRRLRLLLRIRVVPRSRDRGKTRKDDRGDKRVDQLCRLVCVFCRVGV